MANPDTNPEPEPEPQPAWRAQIRAMVADAEARLAGVRWGLDGVPLHLEPMSVGDAACALNRITLARGTLQVVTDDLFFCAALLRAVEILALHAVETYALDLADQETALRRALVRLASARDHAVKAHGAAHGCSGRLLTAFLLLDHPVLPGVDPFVENQRDRTVAVLGIARREAQDCATLVGFARKDMAGDD